MHLAIDGLDILVAAVIEVRILWVSFYVGFFLYGHFLEWQLEVLIDLLLLLDFFLAGLDLQHIQVTRTIVAY